MNKEIPFCSIVIPIYNVEEWIEQSLLSALNQSYQNIEFILIDDCGTDKSMDIVNRILQRYPEKHVRIIKHKKNSGLSVARNTGLKASSGKYVFFMDSDDFLTQDCIETHVDYILKNDADFTDGNVQLTVKKKFFKNYNKFSKSPNTTIELISDYYLGKLHISAWNKLIKREVLINNSVTFIPDIYYEDTLWLLDLIENANKCIYIDKVTYIYNIRPGSITTTQDSYKLQKQILSWNYILNNICDRINTYNSSKLIKLAQKWVGKIRFKVLVRTLKNWQTEYFEKAEKISSENMKNHSKGVFGYLANLNLKVSKRLFYIPSKLI